MELDLLLGEHIKLLDKPFAEYLTKLFNAIQNEKNDNKHPNDFTSEWWNEYVIPNINKSDKKKIKKQILVHLMN